MVWESFKLHVRMILTSQINKHKADSAAALDRALCDLSASEQLYVASPFPAGADLLKLQTKVVDHLHYEAARRILFFAKQKLFEHGEKAGKLLAYLVHMEDRPPTVISLTGPDGDTFTEPQAVANRFRDFFLQLYTSQTTRPGDQLMDLLAGNNFPKLNDTQVTTLEALLMSDEVAMVIASFHRSMAPGSDGLPVEFYVQYSELLTPKLLALYNHLCDTFTLPPSMREATIVLIPKPGKDPGFLESYRPISLLQVDIKILAKVLALRLNQVILSLIHADQAGFMPGCNTSFNLRRLYINLQTVHTDVGSRVVVTLDTAKAFDSIEWQYLWGCLRGFGFGPKFIKWVQLLYQAPKGRVVTNGRISQAFDLTRGTRQGCPPCCTL